VLRGNDPPSVVDGLGGWEVQDRPRRTGVTTWKGRNPYRMDVPILFNGWPYTSVEKDIAALMDMATGSDLTPPPAVTIDGVVPIRGIKWVIDGIDFGTSTDVIVATIDGVSGRLRQDAVVHFLQYQPEVRVNILTTNPLPNRYVTKKDDTLKTVARLMYGNANLWTSIRDANSGYSDPNQKLKAGINLVIPTDSATIAKSNRSKAESPAS
jgi:phage tail protein X